MDDGFFGRAWRSLTGRSGAALHRQQLQEDYAAAGMTVGPRSNWTSATAIGGTHGGIAFVQKLVPGSRSDPAHVELCLDTALDEDLRVARETGTDSFFKSIGFAVEVQTGDAAFDGEFYLSSRSPEFLAALFRAEPNRAALRALFAQGFERLELEGGVLLARKGGGNELLELATLRSAVESLARLRKVAEAARAVLPAPRGMTTNQFVSVAGLASLALIAPYPVAALIGRPLLDGSFALFLGSLPWFGAAMLAFVLALAAALRGRSNAHREFFTAAVIALIGIPMGGWGAAMLVNERLDASASVAHPSQVLGKHATHGKHDHYYVDLKSWRPGRHIEQIEVSSGIYGRVQDRQPVVVRTHSGRLGFEWVESLVDGRGSFTL